MFSRTIFRPAVRTFRKLSSSTLHPRFKQTVWVCGGTLLTSGAVIYSLTASSFCACAKTDELRKDISAAIEEDDSRRNNGTSIAATLIRLAWHASGTYSAADQTGGSNGCYIRHPPESTWGANAGLGIARDFLEQIKKKHPDVSYADIYTLAGAVAVEHMGGPRVEWKGGRTDDSKPSTVPDGRLPSADSGSHDKSNAHTRAIFGRMGFNDREMVALIGAHAVGRCHPEASGYWGPWTRSETSFSNEFFRLLLKEEWNQKKTHNGKKWNGPMQYEDKSGAIMMLPADLALKYDPAFKEYVELYAKDEKVFFDDFAGAFSKLLSLGVPTKCCHKKKSGLLGLGFWGL